MPELSENQLARIEASMSMIAGAVNKNTEQVNSTLSKIAVELRDIRVLLEQLGQATAQNRQVPEHLRNAPK